MVYDAKESWELDISKSKNVFPAQGLIRIIRGAYPDLSPIEKFGSALDVGCGDGRNSSFLRDEGFEVTGLEITESICEELTKRIPDVAFVVGESSNLPFENDSFDVSLSWHSIYYVSLGIRDVTRNFEEIFRVTKKAKKSRFILSVPMPTNFIYDGSEVSHIKKEIEYRSIKKDPFNIRNGEILGCFPTLETLTTTLRQAGFTNLQIGEERGNWFGFQYDWWVVVAELI